MTLNDFNRAPEEQRRMLLYQCCGSATWVNNLLMRFPFPSKEDLYQSAANCWQACQETDWLEAFAQHPKIGDREALARKFPTAALAATEQAAVAATSDETLRLLALKNSAYETRFGYIFIVCATGKSAEEMLTLLEARLQNEPVEEVRIAMMEQQKITFLRLQKLFAL